LCFIPLHLAVLLYLFQQGSLPETLTEMNESFIIHTIYRHLKRHEVTPSGVVDKLEKVPQQVLDVVHKLAKIAFKGLESNKLVFTLSEMEKVCPSIILDSLNGFGLLQAVQHFPQKGAGETISFNFVHYTMQEYLAAQHVTTFYKNAQLSLMENTFWDGHFMYMWMMFVGIVGVKSEIFISFISAYTIGGRNKHKVLQLSQNILNDKRKCLQLFLCFMEAKSAANTPEVVTSMFNDGKVTLEQLNLLPHHITLITLVVQSSSMNWTLLQLRDCGIGDTGMSVLEQFVTENINRMPSLEYFDLNKNPSSPWRVYCSVIRHCDSNR